MNLLRKHLGVRSSISRFVRFDGTSKRGSSAAVRGTQIENSAFTTRIVPTGERTLPQPSKASTSNLIELAAIITRETEKFDKYIKDSGIPAPSFDVDAPLDFPKLPDEIRKSREEVVRATKELGDLVTGPREGLRWMAWDHNNSLSLSAIYTYGIAKSFPVDETTTYSQIAAKVNLDVVNVRRFMHHAMTNRIFKEVKDRQVAHTAASRILAEDQAMNDWVGFVTDDVWPAATKVITALKENPSASEPTQTGFTTAFNTTNIEPMFVTLGRSASRARRIGGAMTSLTGGEGYEIAYLLQNYDWVTLNAQKATIVDVGGSHGTVCIELAKLFPDLKFIVQDLPKTISSAPELSPKLTGRIKFQAHDFFTPQPVKGADVYLFRWVFHNYSDKYASLILKNLIPALKKGARVVINDYCLHDGFGKESSLRDEKIVRSMDLVMLTMLNARERNEEGFRTLVEGVDKRFRFGGVRRVEGCKMSVVEVVWKGDEEGVDGETIGGMR